MPLTNRAARSLLQSAPPTFGSWLPFAGRVRGTINERKRGYRLGGGDRRLFQVLRTNFNQVRKHCTQDSDATKVPARVASQLASGAKKLTIRHAARLSLCMSCAGHWDFAVGSASIDLTPLRLTVARRKLPKASRHTVFPIKN